MLIRCHQFNACFPIHVSKEEWAAMRRADDGGCEKFGKLMAAIRASCNGWLTELRVDRIDGEIHVQVIAPKHVDLDKFVDEVRLRAGLAMYECGILERDPATEEGMRFMLEKCVQPKDPPSDAPVVS